MADILVLEPDMAENQMMCETLTRAGHQTFAALNVPQARERLRDGRMMTILNAQLPFTQSYDFMCALAARGLPVLFLTKDPGNVEHLKAMYRSDCAVLLAPFEPMDLLLAVKELMQNSEKTLTLGGLRMDVETRVVTVNDKTLELTTQEFELLQALMRSPNQAVSRDELLRTAWGYQGKGITRTVDVHVQRLRRKLGAGSIETVYKMGYRLRMA